jgi:hypothetical protein
MAICFLTARRAPQIWRVVKDTLLRTRLASRLSNDAIGGENRGQIAHPDPKVVVVDSWLTPPINKIC